jgi:hypothetical protein
VWPAIERGSRPLALQALPATALPTLAHVSPESAGGASSAAKRTGRMPHRRRGPTGPGQSAGAGWARWPPAGTAGCPAMARREARRMGGHDRPVGAIVRPDGAGSSAGSGSGAPLSRSGAGAPRQGRGHRFPMSNWAGRSGSPCADDTAVGHDEPRPPVRGRRIGRSAVDDEQLPGRLVEHVRSIRAADDNVLDPGSVATTEIDPGLDAEGHSR